MFTWHAQGREFHIRDVESEAEFHAIEEIQKEAWGFSDLDIVPAATLVATRWAGGIVLGAFEGDIMMGFAYAFPSYEAGRVSMHSHMLAVRPDRRNLQIGYYLKLAQRSRALEMGLDEITWTFDPLQSLNAHLNFAKLGVTSRRYIVNFYGEQTSSPLHQGFGTDRLWVNWLLDGERVKGRVEGTESQSGPEAPLVHRAGLRSLVYGEGDRPLLLDFNEAMNDNRCLIEIPGNITSLKQRDPEAARAWREATRGAFLAALESGFHVEEFLRLNSQDGPRSFYLLTR